MYPIPVAICKPVWVWDVKSSDLCLLNFTFYGDASSCYFCLLSSMLSYV